jgi:hypothetical protein
VTFAFFLEPLRPPPPAVGVFCIGLSILLSSLLREFFSSCALRAAHFKASERRSKARYVQVLAPFCRYLEVIWGEELVEILGRKEMGILRRTELEGLHFGRAIGDWLRSSGGCRIVNLGALSSASGNGTGGPRGFEPCSLRLACHIVPCEPWSAPTHCENTNKSVCFHSGHIVLQPFQAD